jgi:hypothetical protein
MKAIAGSLVGCAIGACLIGYPGMFLGSIVGAFLGWAYKP